MGAVIALLCLFKRQLILVDYSLNNLVTKVNLPRLGNSNAPREQIEDIKILLGGSALRRVMRKFLLTDLQMSSVQIILLARWHILYFPSFQAKRRVGKNGCPSVSQPLSSASYLEEVQLSAGFCSLAECSGAESRSISSKLRQCGCFRLPQENSSQDLSWDRGTTG